MHKFKFLVNPFSKMVPWSLVWNLVKTSVISMSKTLKSNRSVPIARYQSLSTNRSVPITQYQTLSTNRSVPIAQYQLLRLISTGNLSGVSLKPIKASHYFLKARNYPNCSVLVGFRKHIQTWYKKINIALVKTKMKLISTCIVYLFSG